MAQPVRQLAQPPRQRPGIALKKSMFLSGNRAWITAAAAPAMLARWPLTSSMPPVIPLPFSVRCDVARG
jgi:hypothetical protein